MVRGGDYSKGGEFSDYVWYGFLREGAEGLRYQRSNKLPYANPDRQVHRWLSEILATNKLRTTTFFGDQLDVAVRKMRIESRKDGLWDYRACVIDLPLTFRYSDGVVVRRAVEGMAKLPASGMKVVSMQPPEARVVLSFDDPPVCKLAIANALRSRPPS